MNASVVQIDQHCRNERQFVLGQAEKIAVIAGCSTEKRGAFRIDRQGDKSIEILPVVIRQKHQWMQCRAVRPLYGECPLIGVEDLGLIHTLDQLIPLTSQIFIFRYFVEDDESQGSITSRALVNT